MYRKFYFWFLSAVLLQLASAASAQDQVLREQLFARADQAMLAANEALANVLAPESYADAARFYRNAENNLQRGRSL